MNYLKSIAESLNTGAIMGVILNIPAKSSQSAQHVGNYKCSLTQEGSFTFRPIAYNYITVGHQP